MGITKNSYLLDVECGPGRASQFLIDYLNPNNYYGIDINEDFINIAKNSVQKYLLNHKNPVFKVVQDFHLEDENIMFDYALAFSVLNHCNNKQKHLFFKEIPLNIKPYVKIYITHARWFDESFIDTMKLCKTKQIIDGEIDTQSFGWNDKAGVFPIIELTRLP